jgi:hypothetical protein
MQSFSKVENSSVRQLASRFTWLNWAEQLIFAARKPAALDEYV